MRAQTICFLIQSEPLFKGHDFNLEMGKKFLTRIQSISPDAIDIWAKAIDARKTAAALALIEYDSLFDQDRFQEAAFKKEVEAFQRLNSK